MQFSADVYVRSIQLFSMGPKSPVRSRGPLITIEVTVTPMTHLFFGHLQGLPISNSTKITMSRGMWGPILYKEVIPQVGEA